MSLFFILFHFIIIFYCVESLAETPLVAAIEALLAATLGCRH
jgi:hypothetical protein